MANQTHGSHGQNGMRTLLKPETTTFWVRVLYGVCVALFLAGVGLQVLTHAFDHAHFGFETWPGFYGVFGFAVFVFIVFAGTLLRKFVRRDEDYYQPDEPERSR